MAEKDAKHYKPSVIVLTIDNEFLLQNRPSYEITQCLKDIKEKHIFSKAIVFRHKSTKKQSHAHVCISVPAANKKFEKFSETFTEIVPRTKFITKDDKKTFEDTIRSYFKKSKTEIVQGELEKFEQLAFCQNFDVSVFYPEKLSAWDKNEFFKDLVRAYKLNALHPVHENLKCDFFDIESAKNPEKQVLAPKRPSTENLGPEEKVLKEDEERNEDENEYGGIEVPAELTLPILGKVPLTKPMQARYLSTKVIQEYMKQLRPKSMHHFEMLIPEHTKLALFTYIGPRWRTDAEAW